MVEFMDHDAFNPTPDLSRSDAKAKATKWPEAKASGSDSDDLLDTRESARGDNNKITGGRTPSAQLQIITFSPDLL